MRSRKFIRHADRESYGDDRSSATYSASVAFGIGGDGELDRLTTFRTRNRDIQRATFEAIMISVEKGDSRIAAKDIPGKQCRAALTLYSFGREARRFKLLAEQFELWCGRLGRNRCVVAHRRLDVRAFKPAFATRSR